MTLSHGKKNKQSSVTSLFLESVFLSGVDLGIGTNFAFSNISAL